MLKRFLHAAEASFERIWWNDSRFRFFSSSYVVASYLKFGEIFRKLSNYTIFKTRVSNLGKPNLISKIWINFLCMLHKLLMKEVRGPILAFDFSPPHMSLHHTLNLREIFRKLSNYPIFKNRVSNLGNPKMIS